MVAVADRHVAEVTDVGARQNFPVALAQAAAQLVLVGENAVLGEPADFDVPVEHHHLMSLLGHDVGDGQPGWSGADDDNQMFRTHLKNLRARETLSRQKIGAEASMPKKKLSKRLSPRAPWLATGQARFGHAPGIQEVGDRKSTRLNSSHVRISYAVFCLKKKNDIGSGKTGIDEFYLVGMSHRLSERV